MQLYDLLKVDPTELKVHLAVHNGVENPLDLYFDDTFKEWQGSQNQKNFERKYILALIRLDHNKHLWLFAGVYLSHGVVKTEGKRQYYHTELTGIGESLRGRLIVYHRRKGRQSYPYGESLIGECSVYEIKPEPLAFSEFSAFKEILLTRKQLELMYRHQYPSWKAALSSVSGVYLLSDSLSGKLYVGSAYGENGFWSRWSEYYNNYHGGNSSLKELYKVGGADAFDQFHYSILETCDIDLSADSVIQIENRWKSKLLTRKFGLNNN